MPFPKCVLTGEFTKQENSTMPGLEMNPQEEKHCFKMFWLCRTLMKNLPNSRLAKSRVIRSLDTDKLGFTQMSSSHV